MYDYAYSATRMLVFLPQLLCRPACCCARLTLCPICCACIAGRTLCQPIHRPGLRSRQQALQVRWSSRSRTACSSIPDLLEPEKPAAAHSARCWVWPFGKLRGAADTGECCAEGGGALRGGGVPAGLVCFHEEETHGLVIAGVS